MFTVFFSLCFLKPHAIIAQNELESSSKFIPELATVEKVKELVVKSSALTTTQVVGFDHINRSTVALDAADSLISHFERKRFGLALRDVDVIISKNQQVGMLYYVRGMLRNYLLGFRDALTDFNKAIKLNYLEPECYFERGFAYLNLNQFPDALADYDQGISQQSKLSFRYFERGKAYYLSGKVAKALEDFNFLLNSSNPEPVLFSFFRGNAQLKLGMYDEAIKSFNRVVARQPYNGEAHFQLGHASYEFYDYKKALENFDAAKRLGYNIDAGYFKGMCFAFLKQFDSASKYLVKLPEGFGYQMLSASISVMRSDFNNALQSSAKAVALFESPESLNLRGFVLFKLGKYQESITDFDKAVTKGGTRFNPRFDYREEAAAKIKG